MPEQTIHYTHIGDLPRTHFRVSSNRFLWNLVLILPNFCNFLKGFHPNFCQFSRSRFPLTHQCFTFFRYLMVNFTLFTKGKFQGLYEGHRKTYFKDFRSLANVSCEIQGFQGSLNQFQGFQGSLETLHMQGKVSYFHSKYSTL